MFLVASFIKKIGKANRYEIGILPPLNIQYLTLSVQYSMKERRGIEMFLVTSYVKKIGKAMRYKNHIGFSLSIEC